MLSKDWIPACAGMMGKEVCHSRLLFLSFLRKQESRSTANLLVQILPVRIRFLNQFKLPLSFPLFKLLFSGDGHLGIVELLVMYELMNVILIGKPSDQIVLVFVGPFDQITGYADIQRPVLSARKNIDIIILHCIVLDSASSAE